MQDKHAAAAAKAGRSRQPANRCIIMGAGDLPLGAKIKVTHAHDGHDWAVRVEVAALCSVCTFHPAKFMCVYDTHRNTEEMYCCCNDSNFPTGIIKGLLLLLVEKCTDRILPSFIQCRKLIDSDSGSSGSNDSMYNSAKCSCVLGCPHLLKVHITAMSPWK